MASAKARVVGEAVSLSYGEEGALAEINALKVTAPRGNIARTSSDLRMDRRAVALAASYLNKALCRAGLEPITEVSL